LDSSAQPRTVSLRMVVKKCVALERAPATG
jgi:hypothetical protein